MNDILENPDALEKSEPVAIATLEAMADEAGANDEAIAKAVNQKQADKAQAVLTDAERQAGAQMMAMAGVNVAAALLTKRYPYVTLPDEEKTGLANRAAPLLMKHGGEMPAWMLPYKDEFAFGLALAGTMFGVVMQIQGHNAEMLAQADAKAAANQPQVPA
jgi:hypothetical protein